MRKRRVRKRGVAACAALCLGATCAAESIDTSYTEMALFGIDRNGGHLTRFEFMTGSLTDVGHVRDSAGNGITGIEASAYIPGFRNLFAFWQDPADGQTKLLYVHTGTAQAAVVGNPLGHGRVDGAVAVQDDSGWQVYALLSEGVDPVAISGELQINPNSTEECSFYLTLDSSEVHPEGTGADGSTNTITIDDLRPDSPVSTTNGVYFKGAARFVHVQPKGPGVQNTLYAHYSDMTVEYEVFNSNTYDISVPSTSDPMSVVVWNDFVDPSTGRALGKWHVAIDNTVDGTIEIACGVGGSDGTPGVDPENKLVKVDHKTGGVTDVMDLSHAYSSLASTDGKVFYAYTGRDLYKIDTTDGSETMVGSTTAGDEFMALEFAGTMAMGFDQKNDHLIPVSVSSANNLGSPANLGIDDQGTMFFMPLALDPDGGSISFD